MTLLTSLRSAGVHDDVIAALEANDITTLESIQDLVDNNTPSEIAHLLGVKAGHVRS